MFDPDSGSITFTNAGHPPPLVIEGGGPAMYLEQGRGPPIGAATHVEPYVEASARLSDGSTLLLFTDGLVERRGSSLREGFDRLKAAATAAGPDADSLCGALLAPLIEGQVSDDVAILALRSVPARE